MDALISFIRETPNGILIRIAVALSLVLFFTVSQA
jgi:hypothetical protein